MTHARRERGVVLLVVLFFALLLASGIATFLRRSTIDAMISRNRESAVRAEALARGGLRLAEALLLEDRLREATGADLPLDTRLDAWARPLAIETPEGAVVRLRIEDTGARLNLNALFEVEEGGALVARSSTESFLIALLEKAIEEIPLPPGEKHYDVRELTANLIDFVDGDDVRQRGGGEDEYYQKQDPPYRAANRPLLSPDELRLVEGFDRPLVEALLPYVSVYPHAPGGCDRENVGCGVNLNTAPPHVLALLYYDDGVELRLAPEDLIRQILELREKDDLVCPSGQSEEGCTPIGELVTNAIFPPPTFSSNLFVVTVEARVGEVRRTLQAVVDRSKGTELRLLSWQAR
jgi:general secretion pathway protein K